MAVIMVSLNIFIGSLCGHAHSSCQIGTKPAKFLGPMGEEWTEAEWKAHVWGKLTRVENGVPEELVDLYRGKISVISEVDRGSTFTVKLPISKEQFKEEEIVTIASDEEVSKQQKIPEEPELTEMEESQYKEKTKEFRIYNF